MKTVNAATFVEHGEAAVARMGSNRIEAFDLALAKSGDLVPSLRWKEKMSHVSDMVEAPRSGMLICSDTSGRHIGIDLKTGAVRWTTKPTGEGHAGVVIEDPIGTADYGEAFLFVSWKGNIDLLDPATGQRLDNPCPLPHMITRLHRDVYGNVTLLGTRVARDDTSLPDVSWYKLNCATWTLDRIAYCEDAVVMGPCPDGQRYLRIDYHVPPEDGPSGAPNGYEAWSIRDTRSHKTLTELNMPVGRLYQMYFGWSGDGRYLWTWCDEPSLILRSDPLEIVAELPGDLYRDPAFHPNGEHLLYSWGRRTRIAPLETLIAKFPPKSLDP